MLLACAPAAANAAPGGALAGAAGAADQGSEVSATVTGLRSARGKVVACLTARPAAFPECARDPEAIGLTLPAAEGMTLDFGHIPPGRYAISMFHDENGNGRLDKRLMMPREGYGFSRNAPVRFGPPSFASAAFAVGPGNVSRPVRQNIRMRYIF